MLAAVSIVLAALAAAASAQVIQDDVPAGWDVGDCVSGRINFDQSRIRSIGNVNERFAVDRERYLLTHDYGNVEYADGGVYLNVMRKNTTDNIGDGARFSTTRYMRYGKITARFRPVTDSGVVTTLITWSDLRNRANGEWIQDEIDWETVGLDGATTPQYNLFTYKSSALERGSHGGEGRISINPAVSNDFTIDWRHDRIDWILNGRVSASINKVDSKARTSGANMPPGAAWFPDAPSRVQFSVWDGSGPGTRGWAGGPIPWGNRTKTSAFYEYIDIQCYDDQDRPVSRFTAKGGPDLLPVSTTVTTTTATATGSSSTTASATASPTRAAGSAAVGISAQAMAVPASLAAFAAAAFYALL
ncbi:concanavalin A-like lectin/glucanase domain-containing protein [Entophlyctis helioformis]|nr:concanavalin A-like lectin/glucanase domain-containing protein [Entophlyctis helioformis]